MNKINIFLSASLVFMIMLMLSCENDATNVEQPEFVKKLVVQCFISPADTVIVARVNYNKPVFGENTNGYNFTNPTVSGVKVFLSDGEKEVQFTQKGDSFLLKPDIIPIIESKTYFLRVTDTLGNTVTSQCTIPIFSDIYLKIDTVYKHSYTEAYIYDTVTNNFIDTMQLATFLNIDISFEDNSGKFNNYRLISFETIYRNDYIDSTKKEKYVYIINDKNLFEGPSKGNKYRHVFQNYLYSEQNLSDSIFYELRVLKVNSDYSKYVKSFENYSGEDSYFIEASPIYSNINGGLGIFCGYSQRTYNFKLDENVWE